MAWDYYSTPWFRARDPFAPDARHRREPLHRVAVGGPILLPEALRRPQPELLLLLVRDLARQRGPAAPEPDGAARLPGAPGISPTRRRGMIRDPSTATRRFPATVFRSRINPVSQKIQERFYPLPNFGDTSAPDQPELPRAAQSRPFDPNTYYTISRRSPLLGQKTFVRPLDLEPLAQPRLREQPADDRPALADPRHARPSTPRYTHTISPNTDERDTLRHHLQRQSAPRPVMGKESSGTGTRRPRRDLPDINGVLDVSFSGLGLTGSPSRRGATPASKLRSAVPGALQLVSRPPQSQGGVHRHTRTVRGQSGIGNLFGNVDFSEPLHRPSVRRFPARDSDHAAPRVPADSIDRIRWALRLFVTDDYKFTPEPDAEHRPPLRVSSRLDREATASRRSSMSTRARLWCRTARLGSQPALPRGYVDVVEASQAGSARPRRSSEHRRNNFAPAIRYSRGARWGNDTVFRAGYGIFYDIVPRAVGGGRLAVCRQRARFTNPADAPTVIFPACLPATLRRARRPSGSRRPCGRDLRDPYSHAVQLHHRAPALGYRLPRLVHRHQHAAGRVGLQHQPARRLTPAATSTSRAASRTIPAITYITNGAGHQYHSLTLEVDRRWPWPLLPVFLGLGARYRRSRARRVGRERIRPRARTGVWLDIPTHRPSG